ncbi:prevent-host-death protein [Salipiger marinus]|uniref:prevent-host-death protein n=1 Tax=Salipiger marinus TaxID=555512 RepID=UPI000E944B8B|nr:prevent-host-death protein [Salipiger manganoxidans]MCD1617152.1 prevent-host-death protein [Salipiger manganoxidans]MEB3417200.1 prevent-host-death protein [Salipiger manganoxidans]HBM59810.1 prevent-host-death protein [Citreicella sp.]
MKHGFSALALTALLAGPVAAQDSTLSGTVAEVFDRQIVLAAPEGRMLVTLPDDATVPEAGARVNLTGTAEGRSFTASSLSLAPAEAPAPAPAPQAQAQAGELPQPLRDLGLTEVMTRMEDDDDDREVHVHARLSEGGWLRAKTERGQLTDVETDSGALPEALLAALLPEAARNAPAMAELTRLEKIDLDEDDGEIEVEGRASDGTRLELTFARDGRLLELDRERDDKRRSMSEAEARETLGALGYSEVGFVKRGGRHVDAVAQSPDGDWVEVRLDDQGRLDRERLWDR